MNGTDGANGTDRISRPRPALAAETSAGALSSNCSRPVNYQLDATEATSARAVRTDITIFFWTTG